MFDFKSVWLGSATLCCALGIGYVMQYGAAPTPSTQQAALQLTDIQDTSSAASRSRMSQTLTTERLPQQRVSLKIDRSAVHRNEMPAPTRVQATGPNPCDITFEAYESAGAMVRLRLTAPCNTAERVTIHHQGMTFSEQTDAKGSLTMKVPALSKDASFKAGFANGDEVSASATVPSLQFYDRVVVQWKGQAGLQLHAREFGADYFEDGHVWQGKAGDLAATALGQGGFLMRLGHENTPDALQAEVYSFPTGTGKKTGDIAMTVEAEVTRHNCEQRVKAQTLEIRNEQDLRVRDLSVEIPSCGSVGDVLVLKNLVEDLTIAAR